MIENWEQLSRLAMLEDDLVDKLRGELPPEVPTILVSEQLEPMRSIGDLSTLASELASS